MSRCQHVRVCVNPFALHRAFASNLRGEPVAIQGQIVTDEDRQQEDAGCKVCAIRARGEP